MGILGMWMWSDNIYRRGAEHVFSHCKDAGVMDIYLLVKGMRGTTAFHSPLTTPSVKERDLLQEALDAAHKRGIRIHAWFTSASDSIYQAAHPQRGLYHFEKGLGREIVSIANEDYLHYMEDVVADMVKRYDVDGVHLDYIRYNHLIYGWSQEDLAHYAAQGVNTDHVVELMKCTFTGDQPDAECIFNAYRAGDQDVIRLADARRQNVFKFASGLTGAARAVRGDICLSAALMPEGAYDDLAFSALHYGQNYVDASRLYDYALPMAYSKAYGKGPEWMKMVARGTMRYGVTPVMGLHAYEQGTGATLLADKRAVEHMEGVKGVCLFREGATALAWAEEKGMRLYNALEEPIVKISARKGDEEASMEMNIAPGEDIHINLPFTPDCAGVFIEKGEASVYLANV
ncbi:MAG: family 10 glycosylhydrolase [Clostridia bacterium]|nr:family 10 glycosylhydrolase [Clostridia bacterium]